MVRYSHGLQGSIGPAQHRAAADAIRLGILDEAADGIGGLVRLRLFNEYQSPSPGAAVVRRATQLLQLCEAPTLFTTPSEMREWLASNEVAVLTDQDDWPTAETAALWKRFCVEALSVPVQK
jgi:hypothetical protein